MIRLIALSIQDTEDLFAFFAAQARLYRLFQCRNFRIEWLTTKHSRYANMFLSQDPHLSSSTKFPVHGNVAMNNIIPLHYHVHVSLRDSPLLQPAQVIIDANKLSIRLSLTAWRAYWSSWVHQFKNGHLPVLPEHHPLRDTLAIHAWFNVIPYFLRNQLLPSYFDVDSDCLSVIEVTTGSDLSGVTGDDRHRIPQRIGPDFRRVLVWIESACSVDEVYMNEHQIQPDLRTDRILPEGLFDATQYAWLMDKFRPSWFNRMMDVVLEGQFKLWRQWIRDRGQEDGVVLDEDGFHAFQKTLRKFVDPWANCDNCRGQ